MRMSSNEATALVFVSSVSTMTAMAVTVSGRPPKAARKSASTSRRSPIHSPLPSSPLSTTIRFPEGSLRPSSARRVSGLSDARGRAAAGARKRSRRSCLGEKLLRDRTPLRTALAEGPSGAPSTFASSRGRSHRRGPTIFPPTGRKPAGRGGRKAPGPGKATIDLSAGSAWKQGSTKASRHGS